MLSRVQTLQSRQGRSFAEMCEVRFLLESLESRLSTRVITLDSRLSIDSRTAKKVY